MSSPPGPPPGPPPGSPLGPLDPSQSFPPSLPNPLPTDQTYYNNRGKASNIYLIAFLAILFVLLIISAGIVVRSYILRRRYQTRLGDAIPGLLLAPRAQGSKRTRLGSMPKITHAWIAEGGDKWNQMMPISAQPVFVKRKVRTVKPNTPDQTTVVSDTTAPPTRTSTFFSRLRHSLSLNSALEPDVTTNEKQAPIPSTPNYRIRVEMLQLAVLIAMPSPHNSFRKENSIIEKLDIDPNDEEQLPEMVFGVTRVNYRQPSNPTPKPT